MRHALFAVASLTALTACDEVVKRPETAPEPNANTQQTWLCGREYVNHAWGYQRRGVILDAAGNIWRYDFKGSPTALVNPWSPKDLSNMSEEELNVRYNGASKTGQVPSDEIARHLPLIAEAAQTPPTKATSVGADMGSNTLYCFTYNAGTYSQVLIDEKGDWERTNPSPAAKTLAAWLNSRLGEVN